MDFARSTFYFLGTSDSAQRPNICWQYSRLDIVKYFKLLSICRQLLQPARSIFQQSNILCYMTLGNSVLVKNLIIGRNFIYVVTI